MPLTQKAELKRQIDELLAAGHIDRAPSPFGAGVLFVEKHDKTFRLCVDYRRLNAITFKDVYPTQRVDMSIDKMNGSRFFAKMDLHSGFHQIRIAQKDVHMTAFQTEWGLFQWLVMPFGWTNTHITFQRVMDMTFQGGTLPLSTWTTSSCPRARGTNIWLTSTPYCNDSASPNSS